MSKIQVNDIVNHYDTGAPQFPKGVAVSGGSTIGVDVGTGASVYSPSNNVLTLGTNNTEKLRIDSSGLIANNGRVSSSYGSPNLLISGTDSTLTLMGDGSTNSSSFTGIKFRVAGESTGDYTKAGIFSRREGSYNDLSIIFALNTDANANSVAISDEKLRITSTGDVGIGTDNPYSAANYKSLTFDDTNGGQIRFRNAGTDKGLIFNNASEFQIYSFANTPMVFKSAATESFRLDTSQRFLSGWGATAFDGPSNSQDISVVGTSSNNGIQVGRYNSDYGAYALTIFRSRGASVGTNLPTLSNDEVGHITWWGDDGTNWRDIAEITGSCDGNTDSTSSPGKIIFKTTKENEIDSTQAMTIKANHNVEIHDGNIVFETSGNGIDFSATGNSTGTVTSELLDDYEEGTFTPNVTFGGNSVGLTYSSLRGGSYTKVGRLVTCYIAFEISNKGSSSGNLMITGLPFTSLDLVPNTSIEGGGSSVYMAGVTGTIIGNVMAAVVNTQSYFDVYYRPSTTASSVSSFSNANATNALSMRFQISYPAA